MVLYVGGGVISIRAGLLISPCCVLQQQQQQSSARTRGAADHNCQCQSAETELFRPSSRTVFNCLYVRVALSLSLFPFLFSRCRALAVPFDVTVTVHSTSSHTLHIRLSCVFSRQA